MKRTYDENKRFVECSECGEWMLYKGRVKKKGGGDKHYCPDCDDMNFIYDDGDYEVEHYWKGC